MFGCQQHFARVQQRIEGCFWNVLLAQDVASTSLTLQSATTFGVTPEGMQRSRVSRAYFSDAFIDFSPPTPFFFNF